MFHLADPDPKRVGDMLNVFAGAGHAPRMTLEVGDPAPHSEGRASDGRTVRLGDFAGRTLVLFFYPKDGSPFCTRQACSLRDTATALRALNAAARRRTRVHGEARYGAASRASGGAVSAWRASSSTTSAFTAGENDM